MKKDDQAPIKVLYPRGDSDVMQAPLAAEKEMRNRDLDPQLVWRGKDQQDWSDLVVHAPPICAFTANHHNFIVSKEFG